MAGVAVGFSERHDQFGDRQNQLRGRVSAAEEVKRSLKKRTGQDQEDALCWGDERELGRYDQDNGGGGTHTGRNREEIEHLEETLLIGD